MCHQIDTRLTPEPSPLPRPPLRRQPLRFEPQTASPHTPPEPTVDVRPANRTA